MIEKLFHLCQDGRLKRAVGRQGRGVERPRQSQDCIQIRLGRQPELRRRRPKCLNVTSRDLAVERETLVPATLQIERQLHVAPGQFLFEQAAQFHLQRIAVRRHTEVDIQETMVHRLQRQSEAHRVLARHTASRVSDLTLHLCKPGHGTNRHWSLCSADVPPSPCQLPRRIQLRLLPLCELKIIQPPVRSSLLHELFMRPDVLDRPVLEHDNPVGTPDG